MSLFKKLFGTEKKSEPQKEKLQEIPNDILRLKSRDKYKNSEFFYSTLNKIIKNRESVAYKLRDEYVAENNLVALRNFGNNISSDIYIYISYWFSMGKAISKDWEILYLENFPFYLYAIDKEQLMNGQYYHSSRILSLGILLEIDKEEFKKISKRYVEEGYEDFILDSLVHSQYSEHPIGKDLQFPNETYIRKLTAMLKADSKQEAETIANDILEHDFYTEETLQSEYESHKTEFYAGYWAWEVAALVKILGLDDSSFKNNSYYPYDMVHLHKSMKSGYLPDNESINNYPNSELHYINNINGDQVPVYEYPSSMVEPVRYLDNNTIILVLVYNNPESWCEILSKDRKKGFIQSSYIKKMIRI
jgi:hypothetical protein